MKQYFSAGALTICGFLLSSCIGASEVSYKDVGGGFIIKTIAYVPGIDAAPGRELHYRDARGKDSLVWKHLTGGVYTHNGIAVFIGWMEDSNGIRGDAYLAAKGSGPVVAIAKTVLTYSAKQTGVPKDEDLKRYIEYKLEATDSGLQFEFAVEGVNQQNIQIKIPWTDMSKIIETLAQTGQPIFAK